MRAATVRLTLSWLRYLTAPILARLPEAREVLFGRRGLPCLISLARAWRDLRTNQLPAARSRVSYVLDRQPHCGRAHLLLGQILLRSGDAEGALKHLNLAAQSRLARRDGLVALGNALGGDRPRARSSLSP